MKPLLAILSLLFLISCEKPQVISQGTSYQRIMTRHCYTFGYCYTCIGGCGFKASAFCDGNEDVLVETTPTTYRYKSNGKTFNENENKILKIISNCEE